MSLQNWREQGCHNIALDKLSKSALKRLKELHLDDIDELYSIHITGKERIFCIKMNNVMKVLWWDPLHKVCPSKLKHT